MVKESPPMVKYLHWWLKTSTDDYKSPPMVKKSPPMVKSSTDDWKSPPVIKNLHRWLNRRGRGVTRPIFCLASLTAARCLSNWKIIWNCLQMKNARHPKNSALQPEIWEISAGVWGNSPKSTVTELFCKRYFPKIIVSFLKKLFLSFLTPKYH